MLVNACFGNIYTYIEQVSFSVFFVWLEMQLELHYTHAELCKHCPARFGFIYRESSIILSYNEEPIFPKFGFNVHQEMSKLLKAV